MSRTKIKPKRLADFRREYRDTLAYWMAFRSLGFGADEIFFGFGVVSEQPDILHLQLQTQGKVFTVMSAQLPGAKRDVVFKAWQAISLVCNTAPDADRQDVYRGHLVGSSLEYFATLVAAIQAKGIVVPELPHLAPHAGQA